MKPKTAIIILGGLLLIIILGLIYFIQAYHLQRVAVPKEKSSPESSEQVKIKWPPANEAERKEAVEGIIENMKGIEAVNPTTSKTGTEQTEDIETAIERMKEREAESSTQAQTKEEAVNTVLEMMKQAEAK